MTARSPLWTRTLPWVVMALVGAAAWGDLPETMAVHWDLEGTANGFASRVFAVWVLPLTMLAVWALLIRLAGRARDRGTIRALDRAADGVAALALLMHVGMIGVARGEPVSMPRLAAIAAGALFVVLGNAMGQTRPNPWAGVRTPATLADPDLWRRVNRVGGWMLAGAGLVFLASALVPSIMAIAPFVIAAAAIVPLALSWWWSRRA